MRIQIVALIALAIGLFGGTARAESPCGGAFQRACCIGERSGGACDGGLHEEGGCNGDCRCRASAFSSLGTCKPNIAPAPCGGKDQRACCLGEAAACRAGLYEEAGCTGNCQCKGSPFSSSGTCRAVTPCGGANQRACCIGERSGGACNAGLHEQAGAPAGGNNRCANSALSSLGTCKAVTPCGGAGQRACCALERPQGACDAGLSEQAGAPAGKDNTCRGGTASSLGTCVRKTPCGGDRQRACCAGERPGGACNAGLTEFAGAPAGANNRCANSALSSMGTCRAVTPCGRESQRACCALERPEGACDAGLFEQAGAPAGKDNTCLGGTASSRGTCMRGTPCGGEGQRACCAGERAAGACDAGLVERAGAPPGTNRCTNSALSSSGTCIRVTACGGEGQRACCVAERALACDAGLAEGVSAPVLSLGRSCDLREQKDLLDAGTDWQCQCAAGGRSLGACLRTRFDPTATCWFDPKPKPATPAMSLYVAGLNHDRKDGRLTTQGVGAEQLAKAIIDSAEDPSAIVVALSESIGVPCNAGTKGGPGVLTYNGQCVANALETRFAKPFTYKTWRWWDDIGGPALITGSRWSVVSTSNLVSEVGKAFEVRLRDTRTKKRTEVALYLFHTAGDEKGVAKSAAETEAMVRIARKRARSGDLAPLFVGDFNAGAGGPSSEAYTKKLDWWDANRVCPEQPGVPAAIAFAVDQQLMHVFGGKRDPSNGSSLDFGCTSGHLAPVNLKYSRLASGAPTSLTDGIWLPDVGHNVLGMGLEVVGESPVRCSAKEPRTACVDRCTAAKRTCTETCAGPEANACQARCIAVQKTCSTSCSP